MSKKVKIFQKKKIKFFIFLNIFSLLSGGCPFVPLQALTGRLQQQIVSELAMDGISLNMISSSQTLYDLAKPAYELPRSATTVKSWLLQYSNEKKSKLIETINDLKKDNECFAISLDGMAICVVKFPRKGYKVRYIFGQKSTYHSCRIFALFFHLYPVLEHFILF